MLTLEKHTSLQHDKVDHSPLIEHLACPILVLSSRGIIMYINQAGKRMLNKVVGQRFMRKLNYKKRDAIKELNYTVDDSRIYTFSVDIQAILWKSKRAHLVTLTDLSHYKRLEAEERRKEALENLQQLAGAVAHEFSQPLQILHHLFEIIEMDGLTENRLKKCHEMTTRITKLVRNMRNMLSLCKMPYLSNEIIDLHASSLTEEMRASLKLWNTPQA